MNYSFDFAAPLEYLPDLLAGAWTTLTLSLAATFFGFLVGVFCALASTGRTKWLARVAGAYIEVIRNTPLLVQVFLVYFGMASMGFKVGAFTAATVALVVNVGAYTSEIVRAGIESIPKSQLEAAETLGGFGVLVGPERPTAARYRLENVVAVLDWLDQIEGGAA